MSAVAEAMLAVFDSTTEVTWNTHGLGTAIATFVHDGMLVTVRFDHVAEGEWQVGFDVSPDSASVSAGIYRSVRIFSGVFQAVREFLEIRQPTRLVFAPKQEALADLYQTYMQRQNTELAQLGYRVATASIAPLTEFALEKSNPSAWRN